nr:MAG TPA: hypothetical protein [Caudoviricetes sp.]
MFYTVVIIQTVALVQKLHNCLAKSAIFRANKIVRLLFERNLHNLKKRSLNTCTNQK